jgi:hypothetical protein
MVRLIVNQSSSRVKMKLTNVNKFVEIEYEMEYN